MYGVAWSRGKALDGRPMNQGLAADICIGWPGLEVRHWTNESRVSSRYMYRVAWSRGKALDQ